MNTHEGITQSATAQDCRSHGWGDRALAILRQYCAARKRRKFPGEFTIENFRDYAEVRGLDVPENASAYGSVMRRASSAGLIQFAGYRPATTASAHGRPIRKWVAA
jgi:hypothetical protein